METKVRNPKDDSSKNTGSLIEGMVQKVESLENKVRILEGIELHPLFKIVNTDIKGLKDFMITVESINKEVLDRLTKLEKGE